jgi:hypothetical protein
MTQDRGAYEDALTRWLKARQQYGYIDHGPEPDPAVYGFTTELNKWEAKQIKDRVVRELKRNL